MTREMDDRTGQGAAGPDALDDLFALARAQPVAVPAGLEARILADAAAVQPRPAAIAPRAPQAQAGVGWFGNGLGGALAGLSGLFGGAGALAGMSAVTLTGLYLGIAQPAALTVLTQSMTGAVPMDSLELLPGDTALWSEE